MDFSIRRTLRMGFKQCLGRYAYRLVKSPVATTAKRTVLMQVLVLVRSLLLAFVRVLVLLLVGTALACAL